MITVDLDFPQEGEVLIERIGSTGWNLFSNVYLDVSMLVPIYYEKQKRVHGTHRIQTPSDMMQTGPANAFKDHSCYQSMITGHMRVTGAPNLSECPSETHVLTEEEFLQSWRRPTDVPLNGRFYTRADLDSFQYRGDHYFARVSGLGTVRNGFRDGIGLTSQVRIESQWVNNGAWWPFDGPFRILTVTLLSSSSNYCAVLYEEESFDTVRSDPHSKVDHTYRAWISTIIYGTRPGSTEPVKTNMYWSFDLHRWRTGTEGTIYNHSDVISPGDKPKWEDPSERLPNYKVMVDTLGQFSTNDLSQWESIALSRGKITFPTARMSGVYKYLSDLADLVRSAAPYIHRKTHDGTYYKVLNGKCFDSMADVSMNSLAYIKDGISMFTDGTTVDQIGATIDMLKSSIGNNRKLKSTADLLLSGKYGDRLQLLDTVETAESLINRGSKVLPDSNGWIVTHQSETFGGTETYAGHQFAWSDTWHTQVSYRDASLGAICGTVRTLHEKGLLLTLENAWDLIPYSFVLDWLVDVQSLCKTVDRYLYRAYYEYRRNIISTKHLVQLQPHDLDAISRNYALDGVQLYGTVFYKTYTRLIDQPFSFFTFDRTLTPGRIDNLSKKAITGALIIQRFG